MKVSIAENISVRKIGGELFVFDRKMSVIHSFNKVGTLIWEEVTANSPLEGIVGKICERFEVDTGVAENDLRDYILQLENKNLIKIDHE
jgi:hypothetical protein